MAPAKTQKIALPKRINPVAQYLMVLAIVVCLYASYEQFAVPRLEGPQRTITKVESDLENDSAPLLQDKSRIIAMLGDGSDHWELQPCSTLKLDEGLVLFKKRKNCDDGSVQFSPFTFVSGETATGGENGDGSTKRPFIVRSTEGANIKFNKRFNGINFDGLKPVLCKLQGGVEIYSRSDKLKDESLIYIATRNVTIDAHKITTPEPVEFKFGESIGIGSDLSIELAHPSTALADFSNITGIHHLQLERIEKIRLEPESNKAVDSPNLFQATSTSMPSSKNQMKTKDGPIEVTCNGSFQFNFETGYAEFFDSVTAHQLVQQNKIECDHLLLMFGTPSETQSTPLKSAYPKTKVSELSRLVANGAPAIIKTPSASIKANIVTFDPDTNLFSGQKDQTIAGLPVQIQSDEMQLEADLLRYRANQDGSLGDLQIVGPGWIKFAGKTTKDAISASWQKNLRTLPSPQNSDIYEMVLSGQSLISTDPQTSISAEQISLQIRRTYSQTFRERPLDISTFNSPTTKSAKPNYVPVQLSTVGLTNLRSPEIEGQTEELIAIWLKTPEINNDRVGKRQPTLLPAKPWPLQNTSQFGSPQPTSSTTQSTSGSKTQLLPAASIDHPRSLPQRNLLSSSTTDTRGANTSPTFNSKPRSDLNLRSTNPPKLQFGGQKLTLLLKSDQSKTEVKKMLIQGGVTIKRSEKASNANTAIAKQTNSPFEIKNASEVELEKIDNSDFHLLTIVSDQPNGAELALGEFSVSGKQIKINEKQNKLVIQGQGTLHLNSSGKSAAIPGELSSTSLLSQPQDTTQLNVQWNEGMIFDGSAIYFQKEVIAKTQQQSPDGAMATLDSRSEVMYVHLDKPFLFHNPKNSSPKIREFEFRNHIPSLPDSAHPNPVKILRQKFNPKREQVQKILAHMEQTIVNLESGVTQLTGPGNIAMHRLNTGNAGLPMLTFDQQQPNKGALSFIQIDFEGGMEIDSEKDRLSTDSGARVFYDLAPNWVALNQANLNPGSVTLDCDKLEIDKWAPRNKKQNVELLATGNVTFTSDALDITADRIAYNGSTDKITIKGNIRNDANLVHRKFLGDLKPDRLNARSFSYSVKDKSLSADGMRQLNIK